MRPLFLLPLCVFLLYAEDAARQPVTATDLVKIRQVTSVAVAKDGSYSVYAVRSVHVEAAADGKGEPTYSYRSHIWRVDLSDPQAKPVQLTFGDRNDGGPVLSPDGRSVAFVRLDASRKEHPLPQVWLLPARGPGEAQVVTSLEYGAANPVWRPDGKALLVSSQIPASKIDGKPQFSLDRPMRDWFDWDRPVPGAKPEEGKPEPPKPEARPDGDRSAIRNWLERNASKDNPSSITRMDFLDEQGLQKEMTLPQTFLVDLEKDNKATQLTRGFYPHFGCDWSPDGARIACVSWPASNDHPDRVRRTNLVVLTVKDGDRRVVVDRESHTFAQPRWYPTGNALLATAFERDEPTFRQAELARVDLEKEDFRILTASLDSSVSGARFAADGSILLTTGWQGSYPLLRIGADGGTAGTVVGGPVGIQTFDEGAGRIVFAQTSVENPNELYVRESNGKTRQLTTLNSTWLASKSISLPEEHWLTRPDGTRVQYWVMKPTDAEPGQKYPWVLDMHGGPAAMWGPGELTMWHEFQTFCAWGYGVVYANPRGSSGYGYAFQKGNFKNWGDGPTGDVLAALDETVKSNPLVDKNRLFLTGGSYAGYLTAWIVAHDHRFKAAAAQRGVYDIATFYGEGNAYRLVEGAFGGLPWDPTTRKLLEHDSPFTYVADITTPLLILHGSEDLRTGVTQSEMMYRALKEQRKSVEYIRYPGTGHELTRSGPPLQRMDHMLRIVEFFERYANNTHLAPVEKQKTAGGAPATTQ
jgi:dipeptidyl aminopeptidase/acylaminoacyl peptidase